MLNIARMSNLRLPLEAAGPLFLAVADIDRRRLTNSKNYGIDRMNVLLSIMEPHVDGFSYHFEWQATHNGGGWGASGVKRTEHKDDYCANLAHKDMTASFLTGGPSSLAPI